MTTQDETAAADLRARYGTPEPADLEPVLDALGQPDIDVGWAIAFRYPTTEACEAFAEGNKARHGYESLGPVTIDGVVYGVVVMRPPSQSADDWARGTVARTMRRRQMVQAQGAIANDVLWRRGYPLPDGQAARTINPYYCDHRAFGATVEINRLSDYDGGPLTGYSADIRINCVECSLPFEFIGLPAGLSLSCAMTSLAGDELRAPIKPMDPAVAALLRSERACATVDTDGIEHPGRLANPGG